MSKGEKTYVFARNTPDAKYLCTKMSREKKHMFLRALKLFKYFGRRDV